MSKRVFLTCLGLAPLFVSPAPVFAQASTLTVGPSTDTSVTVGNDPAALLSQNLQALARDPYNVDALLQAGTGALAIGDTNAAFGFFARAEELSPRNWRSKAGLASSLTLMEKSTEALRLFDEAAALGAPEQELVADRGLAYDLNGDSKRAQRDYLAALRLLPSDEVTRRMALSLGIGGEKDAALARLDPLVRRNDQGAWRARAFILAMNGDMPGAERIVRLVAPAGTASYMSSFLQRLAGLSPSAKAHAVHFGTLPASGQGAQVLLTEGDFRPLDQSTAVRLATVEPERRPLAPAPALDIREARRKARQQRDLEELAVRGRSSSEPPVLVSVVKPTPRPATPNPPASGALSPATSTPSAAPVRIAAAQAPLAAPNSSPAASTGPDTQPVMVQMPSEAAATPASQVAMASAPSESPSALFEVPAMPPKATLSANRPALPAPMAARPTGTTALPASTAPQLQSAQIGRVQTLGGQSPSVQTSSVQTSSVLTSSVQPAPAPSTSGTVAPAPAGAPNLPSATQNATIQSVSTPVPAMAPASVGASNSPAPAQLAMRAGPASPRFSLRDIVRTLELEAETAPVALPDAAKLKALRLAAQKKAAAEEKARAEKAEKDRIAAEEAAKIRRNPARTWVQIATGNNESGIPGTWRSLKSKAPKALGDQKAWVVPYLRTNRLLVGPMRSSSSARDLLNDLRKEGVKATIFTSEPGQEIERVGG